MAESDDVTYQRGFFSQDAPPPDGPSPLGWRGYGTCAFCLSGDTVWQHDLNRSLVAFRTLGGSGSTLATALTLCDGCEALYNDGNYGELARLWQAQPWYRDDTVAGRLVGIAALCRADRGPRTLAVPDFPPGFEPWDQFTGAEWMFDLWPQQHRMIIAETRRPQLDDDPNAQIQLLGSPWPSLTLQDALNVLFRWAELDWDHRTTADPYPSRVPEALSWTDQEAKAFLDEHTDEPPPE
jgi:hypothetical protein